MKTLFTVSLIAALAAFSFLSLGVMAAGSVLFAAGFFVIVHCDYARLRRPLRIAPAGAMAVPLRKERFGLAA